MRILSALLRQLDRLLNGLFNPVQSALPAWVDYGIGAALYALGLALWGKFLNWGRIPFDFHDWAEVNAARLAFTRDAVIKGVLPLHMPDASALRGITDRFMALPDVILSPQVYLMKWMDVGTFVLVDTLLFYSLGFLGLLLLRRRFRLGWVAFGLLFLTFNFNGHILLHYSIGHVTWAGYFLFPLVVVLIFQLLDGDRSWAWAARMAQLLFFMYLQGSFHQFVWVLLFLGLLVLGSWKFWAPVLKAGLFAVLLSLVRILPPVLHFREFDSEFLGGYPTLMDMGRALVELRFPAQALEGRNMFTSLGWWEFSLYLGAAGTLFLLGFGVWAWVQRRNPAHGYPALLLPVVGVGLLSLGWVYRLVRFIPIPLLSGERASVRMLILPVVVLLVLAALELQTWLNQRKWSAVERAAMLAVPLVVFHDLWQNLKAWQVTNAFPAFPNTPVNLAIKIVANHPDPAYTNVVALGAAASLISLVVLLGLVWREKRSLH